MTFNYEATEIIAKDDLTYLRWVMKEDLDPYYRWYIDPDIQRFMADPGWTPDRTKDQYRSIFLRHHLLQKGTGATATICLISDDTPVGMVNYFELDRDKGTCELGVVVGEKNHWCRGIGTSAVKLICSFLFSTVHVEQIHCLILRENTHSIRLFEKCGFVFDRVVLDSDKQFLKYELKNPNM